MPNNRNKSRVQANKTTGQARRVSRAATKLPLASQFIERTKKLAERMGVKILILRAEAADGISQFKSSKHEIFQLKSPADLKGDT